MKDLVFCGSSYDDLLDFPKDARKLMGYELHRLQAGADASDWKSMRSVGQGVKEIRVHLRNEYRCFYIATIADAIYVLHVFVKKTRGTPKKDIATGKDRLRDLRALKAQERMNR